MEILLTTVQGLFAAVCLFKFRFLRWEAYALLGLWMFQLFDPVFDPYLQALPSPVQRGERGRGDHIIVREYTSVIFVGLIVFELVRYRRREPPVPALRGHVASLRAGRARTGAATARPWGTPPPRARQRAGVEAERRRASYSPVWTPGRSWTS